MRVVHRFVHCQQFLCQVMQHQHVIAFLGSNNTCVPFFSNMSYESCVVSIQTTILCFSNGWTSSVRLPATIGQPLVHRFRRRIRQWNRSSCGRPSRREARCLATGPPVLGKLKSLPLGKVQGKVKVHHHAMIVNVVFLMMRHDRVKLIPDIT